MKTVNLISFILLIIGGLNWFSIGVFQYDFVAAIFGFQASIGSRIIYILVGIATLYMIYVAVANRGKIGICAKESHERLHEERA